MVQYQLTPADIVALETLIEESDHMQRVNFAFRTLVKTDAGPTVVNQI